MIVFKRTAGFAHDLRYEPKDYVLQPGDIKHADGFGPLPPLEALHDAQAVADKEAAELAETNRLAALRAHALAQEMIANLETATPTQISNWVDAQVTDVASARQMFKRMLLLFATIIRQLKGGD